MFMFLLLLPQYLRPVPLGLPSQYALFFIDVVKHGAGFGTLVYQMIMIGINRYGIYANSDCASPRSSMKPHCLIIALLGPNNCLRI